MKKFIGIAVLLSIFIASFFIINERSIAFALKSKGHTSDGVRFQIKIGDQKKLVIQKMRSNKFQDIGPDCPNSAMDIKYHRKCQVAFFDNLYPPGVVKVVFVDNKVNIISWNYEQER